MPPKSDDVIGSLTYVGPLIKPKMFYKDTDDDKIIYRELPEKIPELSADDVIAQTFDYTSCWGMPTKADDSGLRIDCSGSITMATKSSTSISSGSSAMRLVTSSSTTGASINDIDSSNLEEINRLPLITTDHISEPVIKPLFTKPDFIDTAIDAGQSRFNEFHDLISKAIAELNELYRGKDTKKMNNVLVAKKLPTEEKKDEDKKIIIIMPGIGSGFQYAVDRIVINPPALVVFWKDKTKTIVKCSKGETFNPYYGFCAALAKKVYGCNSRVNNIVKDATLEYNKMQTKKAASVAKKENKVENEKDKPVKKLQTKTKTAKKGTAKK